MANVGVVRVLLPRVLIFQAQCRITLTGVRSVYVIINVNLNSDTRMWWTTG